MTQTHVPSAASGLLFLADISGYTAFLQSVALAHQNDAFADGAVPDAYAVLSSLLDGIVQSVVPPLTLLELEGDAVFAYASVPTDVPTGQAMLDCLGECYAGFHGRLGSARDLWTCWCEACEQVDSLDLKFVLHVGSYVTQEIAGHRKLVGSDVILAHRLLKNGAADLLGHGAYALITESAAERLSIPTAGAVPIVETYEHYPAPIPAHLFSLRAN
jgi:hypothetical protein